MNVTQIKAAVRERDGRRCVECGMSDVEHFSLYGNNLQVHRVVPGSEYSLAPGACQTLCIPCHGPKPRSRFGVDSSGRVKRKIDPELLASVLLLSAAIDVDLTMLTETALRLLLNHMGWGPMPDRLWLVLKPTPPEE